MKKILKRIKSELGNQNDTLTLVTVASAKGSTPRKIGTMMLADKTGVLEGTIGGGLLEYEAAKMVANSVHQRKVNDTYKVVDDISESPVCGMVSFQLDNTKAGALGMVCGGITEILFTPIRAWMLGEVDKGLEYMTAKKTGDLCLERSGQGLFIDMNAVDESKKTGIHIDGNADTNMENKHGDDMCIPLFATGRIILVGGGHVAWEVSKLLDYLDFRYLIIEDRAEFATKERFPNAEAIIVTPLEHLSQSFQEAACSSIGEMDGFCIATRGHAGDTKALRFALDTSASYIGAMGSLRKREMVFDQLEKEGYDTVRGRVKTPIGLDIGAQTPEELAVSIVAELIGWRAKKGR